MRNIISNATGFISAIATNLRRAGRDFTAAVSQLTYNLAMDMREAVTRRFGFTGRGTLGASSWGVFIHLPFTSRSLWVEWREQSVGYGIERTDPKNTEFFAGRIQGVLSVEGVR